MFSPSSLVGQEFGAVGVGMLCFFPFFLFCNFPVIIIKIYKTFPKFSDIV